MVHPDEVKPLSMINMSPYTRKIYSFWKKNAVCVSLSMCVCALYAPSLLKWCSRAEPLCVCSVVSYAALGESEQEREI